MNDNIDKRLAKQVIGCLISPLRTIHEISKKSNLKKATIIILVIAILAGWANYNYNQKISAIQGQVIFQRFIQMRAFLSLVIVIIGVFGSWLLNSIFMHVISKIQGGKGTYKNIASLAGYASTPMIIQQSLRLIDSFLVSEETLIQIMSGYQIIEGSFFNALIGVTIDCMNVFRLWSIALFVIAISENYEISSAKAVIAAVAAYILTIFISLFLPILRY